MKKQTKHSIKAHLLWSALILLSLLAVCAIPFTLAQSRSRGTTKQSVANLNAPAKKDAAQAMPPSTGAVSAHAQLPKISRTDLPKVSSAPTDVRLPIVPQPKLPQIVLYDQYNNAGANATVSQD